MCTFTAAGGVDVIDLVIGPRSGLVMLQEAKDLGITDVFAQPGADAPDVLKFCNENGE